MDHHGNDRPRSFLFIALCTLLGLSLSVSFLACSTTRAKFIHDEGNGKGDDKGDDRGDGKGDGKGDDNTGSTDAQASNDSTVSFDLNASDATWANDKMLRVANNTYVKNPASSAVQQGRGQSQSQSQSQNPMRKGYVFTGWYTETNEAKQNQATRFKFKDEAGVTPNTVLSDITLYAGWAPLTLEGVVKLGKLPSDLSLYDEVTQRVLGPYKAEVAAGARVSAVFVTADGGSEENEGKRDGASWETAWAGNQLKEKLDGINDASPSHVYLFLVSAGEYRKGANEKISTGRRPIRDFEPAGYTTGGWLAMKDEVAIVGGWDGRDASNGWRRGPSHVTNFKGGKAADETQSEEYSVFYNENLKDKATLAYITVSDGIVGYGGGHDLGGGMYNTHSSPMLTNVTFSGNSGNGMYNTHSSPVLTNVTFSGNEARGGRGGGMGNFIPHLFSRT